MIILPVITSQQESSGDYYMFFDEQTKDLTMTRHETFRYVRVHSL